MATDAVIVFPTDFSGSSLAALPWAKRMAAWLNARIDCVYVVEEPQVYATLDMGPVPIPSTDELVASARSRLADFVASNLAGQSPAPAQAVLVGRPADEIVGYARDKSAQLIIMATHGYSGVKHVLLGSTTESVLRHASCPVLSIRSGE
jgi:nucleotide-binding universal stress UspA family protein